MAEAAYEGMAFPQPFQVLAHEYLLNATDAQLAFFRMSDVALGAAPSSRS